MSFTPSDELAVEGRRLKMLVAASSSAARQQAQSALDGLSEDEQKVHRLLVRGKGCNKSEGLVKRDFLFV